jgi:arylsulfatase A-like enzyme
MLLVSIDTWRWDHLGASGSGAVETRHLDRLAREGICEPEAVSPYPLTTPAHASLLTGLDPVRHRVWDCVQYPLPAGIPTLAEAFRSAGFATAAFVASETLARRLGLDRGFETYRDVPQAGAGTRVGTGASRDGSEVTGEFLGFLRERPAPERLFCWLHYYDAHDPYRPRPGLDERYPGNPYAAQVAFIDGEVGRVLAAIGADGRRWRVAVVGDHGEGLGDRGELSHGIGLYRSTLHVPFILHPRPERPLVRPKPWGLVDLMPTLLEWYGLAPAAPADGVSLFQGGGEERALTAMSLLPTLFFGVQPSFGVRRGALMYMRYDGEELYDLSRDPAQTVNLAREASHSGALRALRALCDREWPAGWSDAAPPAARPSREELHRLRSLGYVAGVGGGPVQRAAIGDLMRDFSDWEMASRQILAEGRGERHLALFARLAERYPASFTLRKDYGTTLAALGRVGEAIHQLEAAMRLSSDDPVVLGNLGALYLAEGRAEEARVVLERSVALDPLQAGPQKNLGLIYLDHLHRPDRAVEHFKKYLEAGGDAEAGRIREWVQTVEMAGDASARPGP